MARITVAAGPSNAAARPGEAGYIAPEPTEQAAVRQDDAAQAPAAVTEPGTAATTVSAPDYPSMTVAQLRDAAKAHGLPTTGSKTELLERLSAPAA